MDENKHKKKEKPTKQEIVDEYFEEATIDGLSKIHCTTRMGYKLFWIVVFLTMVGFLINGVVGLFTRVLSNEVSVSIETKSALGAIDFPTVTICNTNRFSSNKTNVIKGKPFTDENDKAARYYSYYWQLRDAAGGQEVEPPYLDYQIASCKFNGKDCDVNNTFEVRTTWSHGKCFIFNNKSSNALRQFSPGSLYGLKLFVFINQKDYDLDIPFSTLSAGLLISVSTNSTAFPSISGFQVAPGEYTKLAIKKSTFTRLKSPFKDNCTEEQNPRLFYGNYSSEICLINCFLTRQQHECGTIDPFIYSSLDFKGNFKPARNASELACLQRFVNEFDKGGYSCHCPPACEQDVFEFQASSSEWPAEKAAERIAQNFGKHFESTGNVTSEEVKSNLLAVSIYFDDFSILKTTNSAGYGWNDFASDLGGELGLWIGASVFSVVELGSFLLQLVSFYYHRHRDKRKQQLVASNNTILSIGTVNGSSPKVSEHKKQNTANM